MRFGLVAQVSGPGAALDELVQQAVGAERAGFDLVWLAQSDSLPAPAVAAAALAPHTAHIHVGMQVRASVNPVYLAEEAAVADLCLGGRTVLALESDDPGLLAETADVVQSGLAPRPFRHEGVRWQIPANLPANVVNREERVRITPASAQLELPVWLTGAESVDVAAERCLTFVGAATASTGELSSAWGRAEARLGPAVHRLRRVAVREVGCEPDGAIDADAVVEQLRADQRGWGMDIVLVALPATVSPDARLRAVDDLARWVVPRVQLDRLPPGLEQYWQERQEATS